MVRNYLAGEYQARAQNLVALQHSDSPILETGIRSSNSMGKPGVEFPFLMPRMCARWPLTTTIESIGGVNGLGHLETDSQGGKTFVSLVPHLPSSAHNFGELWSVAVTPQGVFYTASQHLFRWANQQFTVWRLPHGFPASG